MRSIKVSKFVEKFSFFFLNVACKYVEWNVIAKEICEIMQSGERKKKRNFDLIYSWMCGLDVWTWMFGRRWSIYSADAGKREISMSLSIEHAFDIRHVRICTQYEKRKRYSTCDGNGWRKWPIAIIQIEIIITDVHWIDFRFEQTTNWTSSWTLCRRDMATNKIKRDKINDTNTHQNPFGHKRQAICKIFKWK